MRTFIEAAFESAPSEEAEEPTPPPSTVWSTPGQASDLELAVAENGAAAAVWTVNLDGLNTAMAVSRAPGGQFGAPQALSGPSTHDPRPDVAISASGNAVVVWSASSEGRGIRRAVAGPGGSFTPMPAYTDLKYPEGVGSNALDPSVAVNASGKVAIVWLAEVQGRRVVVAASSQIPMTDSSVQPISTFCGGAPGSDNIDPTVVVAASGEVTAVWRRERYVNCGTGGTVLDPLMQMSRSTATGEFETPRGLGPGERISSRPDLAVTPDGTTTVVWSGNIWTGEAFTGWVSEVTRAPGDSPEYAMRWSGPSRYVDPKVVSGPDGTTDVGWSRVQDGGHGGWTAESVSRPAGGSFSEVKSVSPPNLNSGSVDFAVSEGRGIALLTGLVGGSWLVGATHTLDPTARLEVRHIGPREGGVVTSQPTGIDCPDACDLELPALTTVTLTASVPEGFYFIGWKGACSGGQPTCSVNLKRTTRVTAEFGRLSRIEVARTGPGQGRVEGRYFLNKPTGIDCGPACAGWVLPETIYLVAKPESGSVFDRWSGACEGEGPICELSADTDLETTARFTRIHRLNSYASGPGRVVSEPVGIDCDGSCGAIFETGDTVELSAEPRPGAIFLRWEGACSDTEPTCVVQMDRERTVIARFTSSLPVRVHVQSPGLGSVRSFPSGIECGFSICSGDFQIGDMVKLTATPGPGSLFTGWNGVCEGRGPTCEVPINRSHELVANFAPAEQLTVRRVGSGSGTVLSDPAGIDCPQLCEGEFAAGSRVTMTARPDPGSRFVGWVRGGTAGFDGRCVGPETTCVATILLATTVTARFEPVPADDEPKEPPLEPRPVCKAPILKSKRVRVRGGLVKLRFRVPDGGLVASQPTRHLGRARAVAGERKSLILRVPLKPNARRKVAARGKISVKAKFTHARDGSCERRDFKRTLTLLRG